MANFFEKYGLHPILVANENITIGTLAHKNFFGKVTDVGPQTIFLSLYQNDIISQEEYTAYQQRLEGLPLRPANFINMRTSVDVNFKSELDIPGLGDLGALFSDDANITYSFTDIKSKLMNVDFYATISKDLDEFKAKKWNDYKTEIRKRHYIEELYYGNVEISIQAKLSTELEAKLEEMKVSFDVKGEWGKNKLITVTNENLPFAMRLERVKEL